MDIYFKFCYKCYGQYFHQLNDCPNCKPSLQNKCKICTFSNPQHSVFCSMCQQPLKNIEKKKMSTVQCPHCKQENSLENEQCVFCSQQIYESSKKICQLCNSKINSNRFDQHYKSCMLTHMILQQQRIAEQQRQKIKELQIKFLQEEQKRENQKNLQQCVNCRGKFDTFEMNLHLESCVKQSILLQVDQKTRMTKLQIQAIKYMDNKSQKQHFSVKSALQDRIKKLGYTIEDLNNLQFYVQNYAPIIIHIHINKHMEFFVKDTHYRSQFQTNKSSGTLNRQTRIGWEDRMFDKKYSKASDFQRVKYGVINFTNDPKGVAICSGYGKSYFLLKQHVRNRCTFTDKDSSAPDSSIATFKYCFKILSKMNDNELKAALDAAMAKEISSSCTVTYKQIQIHGPIEFKKDIQRVYVDKNEINGNNKMLQNVKQFCKKNNIDYQYI